MNVAKRLNQRVDLHLHTTASDGSWSPEVLIEKVFSQWVLMNLNTKDPLLNRRRRYCNALEGPFHEQRVVRQKQTGYVRPSFLP